MTLTEIDLALAMLFLIIAALYSSVGHAGASGYIAAMALFGLPAAAVKPTALVLNVLVATLGTWRFARARLVPWRMLLPLIVASVPMAYLGASLHLPAQVYQRILAVVLALSAAQLLRTAGRAVESELDQPLRPMPVWLGLLLGAAIGFVAGITGTGGAIFLTPMLLFAHFATTRIASGASVVFVLANSLAGLGGLGAQLEQLPRAFPWWLGAVAVGALIGTHVGRGALPIASLRRILAIVLLIAAGKLAFF
jgi:hypothetical protein